MRTRFITVLALLLLASVPMFAGSSTFNPDCDTPPSNSTGPCGFAAKGDVQVAFGWANGAFQKNANDVTFSYNVTTTWTATCEFTTPDGHTGDYTYHDITHTDSTTINDTLVGTGRNVNQISGFWLSLGSSSTHTGQSPPTAGAPCVVNNDPNNQGLGGNGVWINTDLFPLTVSSSGGLFAHWNGLTRQIYP